MSDKQDLLNAIKYKLSFGSIKFILDKISDVNFGTTDIAGSDPNPILYLGHIHHPDGYKLQILDELFRRGAKVDTIATNTRSSAIMYYAQQHNYECVKMFIKHGANLKITNCSGYTIENYCANDTMKNIVRGVVESVDMKLLKHIIGSNLPLHILKLELANYKLTKDEANVLLYDCITVFRTNTAEIFDYLVENGANFEDIKPKLSSFIFSKNLIDFLKSRNVEISYLDENIKVETSEYIRMCRSLKSQVDELEYAILERDEYNKVSFEYFLETKKENNKLKATVEDQKAIIEDYEKLLDELLK